MSSGFVYIMINYSMPGLVKIGKTAIDSKSRAKQLRTTGVPTPFEVAFEIYTKDQSRLEKEIHSKLKLFRVDNKREFFKYPLDEAIKELIGLSDNLEGSNFTFAAVSIFDQIKEKYPQWLDVSISDIRIVQVSDRVWLEITKEKIIADYLVDQTIHRSDLRFIVEDDFHKPYFSPNDPPTLNSKKFVEKFDATSIAATTDIFRKGAGDEIYDFENTNHK